MEPAPTSNIFPMQVQAFNELELELIRNHEQAKGQYVHRFTPGLYSREMFIPKGSIITGVTHKTQHPFVISQGDISTWCPNGKTVRMKAPFTGITEAGTRRLGFAHEDTVMTSFHVTNETDPDKIAEEIVDVRVNPLLNEDDVAAMPLWTKNHDSVSICQPSLT
jgi:hypothetical protein